MTVAGIEKAITRLSPEEYNRLREWLEGFDAQEWDAQFERDALSGKLDKIAEQAIQDYRAGKARELWSISPAHHFGNFTTNYQQTFKKWRIKISGCSNPILNTRHCT